MQQRKSLKMGHLCSAYVSLSSWQGQASFLSFHEFRLQILVFAAIHANRVGWRERLREELGGLGSSHTTPFEAAVPARPPTRSLNTTYRDRAPQWATGATKRGTQVVVLRLYSSQRPGSLYVNENKNFKQI